MMWKMVKLGDVCDLIGGGTPSKKNSSFYNGDIAWATVRDLHKDLLTETEFTITSSGLNNSSSKVIPARNLVIASRVGLGKACILAQDTAINQDLRGVIPKQPNTIDVRYLFYWFKSISGFIVSAGRGATVQGVTLPFLRSLELPLPPLVEQQRIVAKLDAAFAEIDRAIEVAESKHTEVEKLKAALFSSLLRGEDWETVKLGEVCELAYGKALDKTDRLESSGYPAYGANGIKTQSKMALYDKPSIIIGRKGSAGEINKVFEPFWALDVTYYAKIDDNIITLDYLFYVLITLNLPSLARGVKPGINRNDVYQQTIPLPSLAEQQRIVAKLDAALAELDRANASVSEAKTHYQALKSAILAQELQPPQREAA